MKLDFFSDINRETYKELDYNDTDKFMIKILWWHFFVLTIGVLSIFLFKPALYFQSPLSYKILTLNETISVIALGLLTSFVMTLLHNRLNNHYHYRLLMTTALIMYSYLIVFTTGGAIEAHFHFFVIFALLCVYYDWRLGWVATVMTSLHHAILNYAAPNWLYFYGRNDFSIISHAAPVILAVLFTTKICENGRKSIELIKNSNKEAVESSAKIEDYSKELEKKVKDRTEELNIKVKDMENFNKLSLGRELKMIELKKRIGELEGQIQNPQDDKGIVP